MVELMIIENQAEKATLFDQVGIDRIFVDLEILGKDERQGHLNTVISRHKIEDIGRITKAISKASLLARINPVNPDTAAEIEQCISQGAQILMLPMFKSASEVERFLRFVNGRVKVNLLLETPDAVENIDEILSAGKIDEIHIGLNDLHLALKKRFMMEMYEGDYLEKLTSKIRSKNISLGIGGIASLDGGMIPGRLIAAEAYRLGSRRFILSRSFPKEPEDLLKKELSAVRKYFSFLEGAEESFFNENKFELLSKISEIRGR